MKVLQHNTVVPCMVLHKIIAPEALSRLAVTAGSGRDVTASGDDGT